MRRHRERQHEEPETIESHICEVCELPLFRGAFQKRKLYHDACRKEASKLFREARKTSVADGLATNRDDGDDDA